MRPLGVIERVKGTFDQLEQEAAALVELRANLASWFEAHGYQEIATPLLEPTELYLRKAGSEILSKTYSFTDQGGRRVSLRPEFTASVIRAYVEHAQSRPLPLRWHYWGPVFRYERPQRGRYRQHTQQGLELIGAGGPRADAEVIALAWGGLKRLGLERPRLILGHVGPVLRFLEHLGLSERVKAALLGSMNALAKGHKALAALRKELREQGILGRTQLPHDLLPTEGLAQDQARLVVERLLANLQAVPLGSREPEEIVERLLRKLQDTHESERLERALAFLGEFSGVKGQPPEVFGQITRVVERYQLDPVPLGELQATVELLQHHGLELGEIWVDFGLARGLAYYSGMVFEIYHHGMQGERQLCGGGRYDGLVKALGSRLDVPALGFAYGLERIQEALKAEGRGEITPSKARGDALVMATTPEAYPYALRVAAWLRREGQGVQVDMRGRSLKGNREYAQRLGLGELVMVTEEDEARQGYRVLSLESGEERYVTLGPA